MLHLYRVGSYREAPPNDYRTILAPRGEPLADLPDGFYSPLPPCPDCGGEIKWAEAGRAPGARKCAGCGQDYVVETAEMSTAAERNGMTPIREENRTRPGSSRGSPRGSPRGRIVENPETPENEQLPVSPEMPGPTTTTGEKS